MTASVDSISQIIGAVGGVGGTAAVISVVYMIKDHKSKDHDRAVSEGQMMEQLRILKRQTDAAHEKIRVADSKLAEFLPAFSELRNDIKWILEGMKRTEVQLDRHELQDKNG